MWQIWNQADKRWMPSEGLKVTAVGNIQVSITGSMPPSCSLHADKLGDFVRLKGHESNKHTVYKKKEGDTMLWHAIGGVAILLVIVAMTIWRGYQRFVWRKDLGRQVTWLYLLCGTAMLLVMGLHGSLGAWLASDFGVHITADQLLASGADLQEALP